MNRHLYRKLVQRGNINAIKELEKRDKILERGDVVYSTQEQETQKPQVNRNKGCMPCSDDVKTRNAFDPSSLRSGRTGFVQREGKLFYTTAFHMRGMRSR